MAIGSTFCDVIPTWASDALSRAPPCSANTLVHTGEVVALDRELAWVATEHEAAVPPAPARPSKSPNRILVVGGGLTAAHMVLRLLADEPNCTVVMAIRGRLRVRNFDVGLDWIGRTRARLFFDFHSRRSATGRAAIVREARTGGSITPEMLAILKSAEASGRLVIWESTEVVETTWAAEERAWRTIMRTAGLRADREPVRVDVAESRANFVADVFSQHTHTHGHTFQRIVLATGHRLDVLRVRLLRELASSHALSIVDGWPVLDDNLQWCNNVSELEVSPSAAARSGDRELAPPVHFLGALAALALGPDAHNLAGARSGSRRLVEFLEERFTMPASDDAELVTNGACGCACHENAKSIEFANCNYYAELVLD